MTTDKPAHAGPNTQMSSDFNAIIHAGGPKCGSSSIQQYLSMRPEFEADDGQTKYSYVVIRGDGSLLEGAKLTQHARLSALGYAASAAVAEPAFDFSNFAKSRKRIQQIIAEGRKIILSSEGWANSAKLFGEHKLLEQLGLKAKVVMFIRPPLDWLNSAYWQWGAWTQVSFDRWYRHIFQLVRWDTHILHWRKLPRVVEAEARLTSGNVVQTFGEYIGCTWPDTERSNTKSPDLLLRFMQSHRDLRPGPHDPKVEFILNRWVDWQDATTPWVIPLTYQERTMERFEPHGERLLKVARGATRAAIKNDPRWRSIAPYKDLEIVPFVDTLGDQDRVVLIKSLLGGISRLENERRNLLQK